MSKARTEHNTTDAAMLALARNHFDACTATEAAFQARRDAIDAFDEVAKRLPRFCDLGLVDSHMSNSHMPAPSHDIRRLIEAAKEEQASGGRRLPIWSPHVQTLTAALLRVEQIEAHNRALPEGKALAEAEAALELAKAAEADIAAAIMDAPADSVMALAVKLRVIERTCLDLTDEGQGSAHLVDLIDQAHRAAGMDLLSVGITLDAYDRTLNMLGFGNPRIVNGKPSEWWPDNPTPVVERCYAGLRLRVNRTPGLAEQLAEWLERVAFDPDEPEDPAPEPIIPESGTKH